MAVQKGKQAAKGQKQILKENEETISFYKKMIIASSIVQAIGIFIFYEPFSTKQITLVALASIIYFGCFECMSRMAKIQKNESGQVIDSGLDLNMEGGFAEHIKDVIIVTAACQFLSIISLYFWFLLLAVPCRAGWFAWTKLLQPYFFQQAPPEEKEVVNEKKQKKMERRMKRQQGR